MLANTDRAWRQWGAIDPYFAVLSEPRFRRSVIATTRREFFETGRAYIYRRLEVCRALGMNSGGEALDFGSGVGRLALALAPFFEQVTGYDVSPAMITEAADNAREQNVWNADFQLSNETLPTSSSRYNLVHSYLVLQHIPVRRGYRYIDALLDRVAVGGVASIHVSLADPRPLPRAVYWLRKNVPLVDVAVQIARTGKAPEPMMQMHSYSLPHVLQCFAAAGFGDPLVDLEFHRHRPTAHIAARRLR